MKAITPIIGIIILLLIVVSLAGSAQTFLFGQFSTFTSKTIKIVPASEDEYKVIVKNTGTEAFNTSEIKIYVEGEQAQLFNPQIVQPEQAAVLKFFPPSIGESKQIRLAGPTNTVSYSADLTFFPLFSCSQDPFLGSGFWKDGAVYNLVNDIDANSQDYCFQLDASNVTFDCKGKKISNTTYGFENGIQFYTVVKNCHVEASDVGIFIFAEENTLENNIFNISGPSSSTGFLDGPGAINNSLINNNFCLGDVNARVINLTGPQRFGSGNRCRVDGCDHAVASSPICKDMGWGAAGNNDCDFNCTG